MHYGVEFSGPLRNKPMWHATGEKGVQCDPNSPAKKDTAIRVPLKVEPDPVVPPSDHSSWPSLKETRRKVRRLLKEPAG